jgi:hypothetical protein
MSEIPATDTKRNLYQAARAWLKRGCSLLPCQSNSKFLVHGFGPVRKAITTEAQAERYFQLGNYNLAVLLHKTLYCLDFDDWSLFTTWSESTPAELQNTHTEITPRGAHLFYRGEMPAGLVLCAGVEIKRLSVVAPSKVKNRIYVDLGIPGFLEIPDYKALIFSLLSEKSQPQPGPSPTPSQVPSSNGDLLSRIKKVFPITELISEYTELRPSSVGERRWLVGICPFHADHKPSLWVDAERGLWGCHACGIRGDVINFYAREHKLTLQGAIRELAGRLPRV